MKFGEIFEHIPYDSLHHRHTGGSATEHVMGKERRNEKMSKKPKKDTGLPKSPVSSDRPVAPVTAVMPRGKDKDKYK